MSKRVLVVDDSKTVRIYHRQILEAEGYTVEEAENGMEAVELSTAKPYDLYLVDINMPVMDGYTFVETMRAIDATSLQPVIMISTESEEIDMDKAFAVGANLYLNKPVRPDDMILNAKILTQGI
jgi:two-component system chemotaxis response regulator CheY